MMEEDVNLSNSLDALAGRGFYFVGIRRFDRANETVRELDTSVGGFHNSDMARMHGRVIEMLRQALAMRGKLECGMCHEYRGLSHTCEGGR
jgi:hypothetical protein